MGQREKIDAALYEVRVVIAENLGRLIRLAPQELRNRATLGRRAGVGRKTVDRLLDPGAATSPTLESIVALAVQFEVEPWELLLRKRVPLVQGQERTTTAVKNSDNSTMRNAVQRDKRKR